jgi:hypothetical protein
MSIEAMEQALEALRNAEVVYMEQLNAMYALQQAIEQAEMVKKGTKAWANTPDDWVDDLRGGAEAEKQKPVAFRNTETGDFCTGGFLRKDWAKWQPLYAAPREWVGLTDEDLPEGETYDFDRGVRWAERYLKEKNHG